MLMACTFVKLFNKIIIDVRLLFRQLVCKTRVTVPVLLYHCEPQKEMINYYAKKANLAFLYS